MSNRRASSRARVEPYPRRAGWGTPGFLLPLLLLSGPGFAQEEPPPCAAAEYRQFDFWLGEWEVRRPNGQLAGTNRISSEFGGCVLQEHYDTPGGYSGSSFNIYDVGRKRWHQTWVDTTGLLLELDGGLVDGSMILEGETVGADGAVTRHRITWTPSSDGSVRQLWETSDESGEWTVAFDGRYTPVTKSR